MQVGAEAIHDTRPQWPYAINVSSAVPWPSSNSSAAGAASSLLSWRLSRIGSAVFAMLLLPAHAEGTFPLQRADQIALPFVVSAPGGVDGSWPATPLAHVSLLGHVDELKFEFSDEIGLLVTVPVGTASPTAHVAVFKLQY